MGSETTEQYAAHANEQTDKRILQTVIGPLHTQVWPEAPGCVEIDGSSL